MYEQADIYKIYTSEWWTSVSFEDGTIYYSDRPEIGYSS